MLDPSARKAYVKGFRTLALLLLLVSIASVVSSALSIAIGFVVLALAWRLSPWDYYLPAERDDPVMRDGRTALLLFGGLVVPTVLLVWTLASIGVGVAVGAVGMSGTALWLSWKEQARSRGPSASDEGLPHGPGHADG